MEPGQYAEYPRPTKGEIDFGVIGEAFQMIFKHPGPILLASALGYFIPTCIITVITLMMQYRLGILFPTGDVDFAEIMSKSMQVYQAQIPMTILQVIWLAPFGYALTLMALKSIKGQAVTYADVFSGFPKILQTELLTLLACLLGVVGVLACCVGVIPVGGLLTLSLPFLVDRNVSPLDAVRLSFERMKPHMWIASLMFIIYVILSTIGAAACWIGLIVTFPVFYLIPALMYRDLVPMDQEINPI